MALRPLKFIKIVEGLPGAEGPVFDRNGGCYMVASEVEVNGRPAGQVLRVDLENNATKILCEPSVDDFGGIPAGCQCDKEGNLYIADMRLGILRVDPNGDFKQLAKECSSGDVMQGCNDCIFDFNGSLWVTAPAGDIAPSEYRFSMEEPFGSVYCLTPEQKVIKVATDFRFPNGIAVAHDKNRVPQTLIVAETPTGNLWAFDIEGPGKVTGKRLWGTLPDCNCTSGPDGMDFDVNGNLLVANWGSGFIEVFKPDGGKPVLRIECPFKKPSNLHFYPNSNKVIVTEQDNHALWQFEWESQGMPQYCQM